MLELHRQLVYNPGTQAWEPMTQPTGGTGGTASNFSAAFPTAGTAAGFLSAAGSLMVPVQLTAAGQLPVDGDWLTDVELRATPVDVNIVGGGGSGGTSSNFGDPFPAAGTAIGILTPAGDMGALAAETFDYDTGGGTVLVTAFGIALPGAGGPVAGGTATNPIRTDPTGTTTQPISAAALPLPTGAATAANQQTDALTDAELRATPVPISGTVTTGGLTDAQLRATPVPVSGTVTANAGTDLNTSLLALEAGGNLAAAVAALQIIDDWDESDRAKVNPIAGQVGVQGGAGGVTALTQRVALATDANAVTAVGTVADDGTTPGAPVMVGGFAKAPDGTDPGNVSNEDDVARFITDLNRRQYVNPAHPQSLYTNLDGSSAYTDQQIAAAPGAGYQIVITNVIGSTGAAAALNFFLEHGSTKVLGPIYLEAVAGRGFASGPIHLPIPANTAVTLTSSAAIAQSFHVEYYIQKV